MYFLHSTITLLVVIAHVQCGTLRQYGPDWLIPKPAPHIDSKRITAKSVFIAPSFQAQNVRCATGFREDGSGRCVKLVHVNQAAQLDFLLQRLNAMYGAPVVNHSEKQPLQVAVEIPVEVVDGNETAVPLKGEEMYSEAVLPEGEVSVDLLAGTLNQPDSTEETATEGNATEETSEGNESEVLNLKPNKEWLQLDEEPLVTLTSVDDDDEDDSVESTTVTPEDYITYSEHTPDEDELPDTLFSVHSEDVGVMANVMKNTSNMVKKETLLGDGSVAVTPESTTKHTSTTETANDDKSAQSVNIANVSHSNHSGSMLSSQITMKDEKTESTEDESINEVHTKSPNVENATSSTSNETKTTGESSSVMSSIQESTSVSSTTQMPTRQPPIVNLTTRETTTLESTTQVVTKGSSTFATDEGYGEPTEPSVNNKNKDVGENNNWEDSGEQIDNVKQGVNNENDYDYPIPDVDVEAELPDDYVSMVTGSGNVDSDSHKGDKRYPVPEGSADASLVLSVNDSVKVNNTFESDDKSIVLSVNDSVKINSTVNGDDQRFSVDTHVDKLEENFVSVNNIVTLNSTKPIGKTELGDGINVSSNNETRFDEHASVSQTSVENMSEHPSNVSEQTVVKQGDSEALKADSTILNVEIQPYEFSEIVHSVSQQMQQQPVITPQHSVHVVYPQPIIEVLNVEPEPHPYPVNVANQHNPKPPRVQFHNLNPIQNPLQHHNVNAMPQMPLMEKAPVIPPQYGDRLYPPLPPQTDFPRPIHHPPHRPYHHHNPQHHQNPHQNRYPQNNPNPSGQVGGFVRFPGDPVKTHHPHDEEVNTVRFPQEDTRNNDKYSRWGNWRVDESRGGQQNYWPGAQETQYPQGTNRRNYWVDNRPNRRRPQPSLYY